MIFPNIDPVAFSVGPLAIRWYGLAYFAGILLGVLLARHYARRFRDFALTPQQVEDFGVWATVGVLLGGRLGYILLYRFDYYWQDPVRVFYLGEGGMAFHGGLAGVTIAALWFCRRHRIRLLALTDLVACVVPIGLLLGRLANFINGELWGRVTSSSWGVVFPSGGPLPRHPSQLYEAAGEGLLLFVALNLLVRSQRVRRARGLLTGLFVAGYAACRFLVEFGREPDAPLIAGLTRGQFYTLPMIALGLALIAYAWRVARPDPYSALASDR